LLSGGLKGGVQGEEKTLGAAKNPTAASARPRRKLVEKQNESRVTRQIQHLLCPKKCECKNSLPRLAAKTKVIEEHRIDDGNVELKPKTYIAEHEIVAVFGSRQCSLKVMSTS